MGLRTRQIIIRTTAEELDQIDAAARQRSMRRATFIRESVLNSVPPCIPSVNREALSHLQRVGGNLNQIAHRSNLGETIDLPEMHQQIAELRLFLQEAKK